MVNKKKSNGALKIVGIAAGAVVGIGVVAVGAIATYHYFIAKRVEKACESCELSDECECCGKYACSCKGDCICEELDVSEEELSPEAEEVVEA